ncbi:hypothetical protein H0H92_013292, partial [Tricholoma furcatifolium]
ILTIIQEASPARIAILGSGGIGKTTPWESLSARASIENLLRDLTSLDTVTLVVTMRGSQRPSSVYWSELLPPLQPVSLDAAVSIFTSICGKSDEFTVKLVKAVDCVPLAVTLLANLASVDGETTDSLWQRWCTEHVTMVENGDDRLSSFENSIEISLSSPRMRRDDEALKLLSILSLLPNEISSQTVRIFKDEIPGIGNVKKAFSTLLQNALIHQDASGCIRILSPIRLHMCARHPPSAHGRLFLQDYFINLVHSLSTSHDPSASAIFRAEYGNIEAMLLDSLELPFQRSVEDIVETILVFCQMAYIWGVLYTPPGFT